MAEELRLTIKKFLDEKLGEGDIVNEIMSLVEEHINFMSIEETDESIVGTNRQIIETILPHVEKAKKQKKFFNISSRRMIAYTTTTARNSSLIWSRDCSIVARTEDRDKLVLVEKVLKAYLRLETCEKPKKSRKKVALKLKPVRGTKYYVGKLNEYILAFVLVQNKPYVTGIYDENSGSVLPLSEEITEMLQRRKVPIKPQEEEDIVEKVSRICGETMKMD